MTFEHLIVMTVTISNEVVKDGRVQNVQEQRTLLEAADSLDFITISIIGFPSNE